MKWILVWIALSNHPLHKIIEVDRYDKMNECFKAREQLIERVGKPIVNYQAICVAYDKDKLFTYGIVKPK